MTLETAALLAFFSVNLKDTFLALPILPSHVSSQRLRRTFYVMARYKFLYCIVEPILLIQRRTILQVHPR